MTPSEAPRRDWGLYYNETFMLYEGKVVNVQVHQNERAETQILMRTPERWAPCDINKLSLYFPRAGSYNTDDHGAVYVGKRAARTMRKSACRHYYFTKWGTAGLSAALRAAHLPVYPTLQGGFDGLRRNRATSFALCRDIIISVEEECRVIFRGQYAGTIKDNKLTLSNDYDTVSKFITRKLIQEGVQCA